jgi:Fructosamine kinase.
MNETKTSSKKASRMGRILASMHKNSSKHFGVPVSKDGFSYNIESAYEEWSDFYTSWFERMCEDAQRKDRQSVSKLKSIFYKSPVPEEENFVPVSMDFHGENILVSEEGEETIIDLERCIFAPRQLNVCMSSRFMKPNVESFISGYNSIFNLQSIDTVYKIGGILREIRISHMLELGSDYRNDIEEIL